MRTLDREAGMTIDTAIRPCIDNDLQHLRADLALHWEDSDTVAKEIFSNVCCCLTIMGTMLSLIFFPQDSLICICIAFAVQTY